GEVRLSVLPRHCEDALPGSRVVEQSEHDLALPVPQPDRAAGIAALRQLAELLDERHGPRATGRRKGGQVENAERSGLGSGLHGCSGAVCNAVFAWKGTPVRATRRGGAPAPRRPLHGRQATTTFASVFGPPCDRGTTWSAVRSSVAPQYAHQGCI